LGGGGGLGFFGKKYFNALADRKKKIIKTIKISSNFSVFSNSGHVGWISGLPNTILKGGLQRTKQSVVPIGQVVSEIKIF
jgi:hypothetical protein